MVLKRILATALGAMGLGALAAGPAAFAQTPGEGNIPAPNLFDGQIACSMNVPMLPDTLVGTNDDGDAIGITARIMDGTPIVDTDEDGVPDGADADSLGGIAYVVPATHSNCGVGMVQAMVPDPNDPDQMIPAVDDDNNPIYVSVEGDVAKDVGEGYTATLEAFMRANEADAAVKTAQDALDALLEDETPDSGQTTQITAAREALAEAEGKQMTAHTELYATGAGPIYRLGIAEWRAKGMVESAVRAWNEAVTKVTEAGSAAQLGNLESQGYVALNDTTQIDGLVDANGNVNLANLRTYANAEGGNTSTQADDGTITGTSNFDAAGNLLIPMSDSDTTTDGVQLGPTMAAESYTDAKARLDSVTETVKALKELQSENQNALLQGVIDEGVRRAEEELKHYQAQFDALVADDAILNPTDPEDDQYSLADRYSAYTSAVTARDNAGVELETAVQAREMATAAVIEAFTDPTSFYQQLVDRRTFLKSEKDAEVMRLAGLTGDDAPTEAETMAATEAAMKAQEALTAAEMAQASFQDLVADDSPVKDLVETLLENGGDDGQALVDAISGAYDVASNAVDDLLGEGGQVAQNMTDIADNQTMLADHETRITQNTEDIAENRTMIGENRDMITTNAGNIAANRTDIDMNTANIAANRTDIDSNTGRITQNESDIMTNAGNIAGNREMIMTNMEGIEHNHTDIMGNRAMISSNEMSIMRNMEDIQTLKSGVAASMALAGMPEMGARGVSVGAGSYGGETALAVGVHFSGENARFKIGVTSSGGETGASLGAGWSF